MVKYQKQAKEEEMAQAQARFEAQKKRAAEEQAKAEEAQKKLTSFGRAAKNAVEKATHDKDLEVVWRAEAVLHTIEPQKFQPQVPQ